MLHSFQNASAYSALVNIINCSYSQASPEAVSFYFRKLQFSKMKVYWFILQILYDIFIPVNSVLRKQQLSLYLNQKPAIAPRLQSENLSARPWLDTMLHIKINPMENSHCSSPSSKKHMTRHNDLDKNQTCWTNADNVI